MKIHLHKNATTTPAQRAFIQKSSHLSVSELADRMGVSKTTVRRWRKRSDVYDRSHAPRIVNRVLTLTEEIKIILCRLSTRAGLDDLQKMLDAFLGIDCSRASLNRCLKRYHISKLPALHREVPYDLRDYAGTYLYYTCFHIPGLGEDSLSLHVLLDCSFRMVKATFSSDGHAFLDRQLRAFPLRVLGIVFQDPVILTRHPVAPHVHAHRMMVESRCRSHGIIAHHLEVQYPKTVSCLKKACASLEKKPELSWEFPWSSTREFAGYVNRYNTRFALGALKQQTPRDAMKTHYTHFPGSFRRKPQAWA